MEPAVRLCAPAVDFGLRNHAGVKIELKNNITQAPSVTLGKGKSCGHPVRPHLLA